VWVSGTARNYPVVIEAESMSASPVGVGFEDQAGKQAAFVMAQPGMIVLREDADKSSGAVTAPENASTAEPR
jgi:hypothetical protein